MYLELAEGSVEGIQTFLSVSGKDAEDAAQIAENS